MNTFFNWIFYSQHEGTVIASNDIRYWLAFHFNFEANLYQQGTIGSGPIQFVVHNITFRGNDAKASKMLIDLCNDPLLPHDADHYEVTLAIKYKLQQKFVEALLERTLLLRAMTQNHNALTLQKGDGRTIYKPGTSAQDEIIAKHVVAIDLSHFLDRSLFPLERTTDHSVAQLAPIQRYCGSFMVDVLRSFFRYRNAQDDASAARDAVRGLSLAKAIALLNITLALLKLITEDTSKQLELLNTLSLGWIREVDESAEASDAEAAGRIQSACQTFTNEMIRSLDDTDFKNRFKYICLEMAKLFTPTICRELTEMLTKAWNQAKTKTSSILSSPGAKLQQAFRSPGFLYGTVTDENGFKTIINGLKAVPDAPPAKVGNARVMNLKSPGPTNGSAYNPT